MADDDETPRFRRPGSNWNDERRALVGVAHRVTTAPRGVPTSQILDDRTPVFDEGDLDLPLTQGRAKQLTTWIKRRTEDTGSDEIAGLKELVGTLKERIGELERSIEWITALRKWLWASSITMFLAMAGFLFTRGSAEGETRQRIEQMDRFIDELRHDVRALEQRHSSVSPAISPDAVSSATERHKP